MKTEKQRIQIDVTEYEYQQLKEMAAENYRATKKHIEFLLLENITNWLKTKNEMGTQMEINND